MLHHTRTGLEGYNGRRQHLKAGWVHQLRLHQFYVSGNLRFVVMGKVIGKIYLARARLLLYHILYVQVKHSQKMSATPLLPWVIVEKQGAVLAAHCTCMAGYSYIYLHVYIYSTSYFCRLEEACSPIAAVLSCLIRATQLRLQSGLDSCTSRECMWLAPAQNVCHCTGRCSVSQGNKFCNPAKRKKNSEATSSTSNPIPQPSEDELDTFYTALNETQSKPAILKITSLCCSLCSCISSFMSKGHNRDVQP